MNIILKLFLFGTGLIFTFTTLFLLLKRSINERNSIVWFLGSISILVVSANPEWLDKLAALLGVNYPPSLLFLFSNLVLLILVLYQSTQISKLNEKLKQLAQHISINDHREQKNKEET